MHGTPWDVPQRYLDNSPIYRFNNVSAALLIGQGTADPAVPVTGADEAFVSLRRLGKRVRYVRYEGEGHSLLKLANQLDFTNRYIGWFTTYLKQ
jgi:dipeptidyl aminopeptidase/acylaminoacyl peptidase